MVLEKIQKANDIKKLNSEELEILAQEIRDFLIEKISVTGGHLASNLGVVELTMAMHLIFDLPEDKIIWDVGHQAYTHKLLTGRKAGFDDLRKYGGMSGFPKRKESDCDAFDTGHSSTSISAGLGYVEAREILGQDHKVISVIGDGSLTGGMAYEALNNAAGLNSNFIIVLNDNNMSISENVGGMSKYLDGLRTAGAYTGLKKGVEAALEKIPYVGAKMTGHIRRAKSGIKQLFVPGMFFEDMGITYLGPVDGHDLRALCRVFKEAEKLENAVLVHVITTKGKGYLPAEKYPSKFHGTGPFDIETGQTRETAGEDSYTDVFSKVIYREAKKEPKLVAITAAMAGGTGLVPFSKTYRDRFFDVGIAEEHAVTFAAGLAAAGLKPVVAIYSSFLQRAYDQLIHDVCLQNLPVVFAIDRAGLVGSDGETHQGLFDLSFLSTIPNMTVMSPKNKWELADMLRFAIQYPGPIAVRYPRGTASTSLEEFRAPIEYGKSEIIRKGAGVAIFSVGHMMETALKVSDALRARGIDNTLVNSRFIKPVDEALLKELSTSHTLYVTIEENVLTGGYGAQVLACVEEERLSVRTEAFGIPDEYVEHGSVDVLRKEVMLDAETITERILSVYQSGQQE